MADYDENLPDDLKALRIKSEESTKRTKIIVTAVVFLAVAIFIGVSRYYDGYNDGLEKGYENGYEIGYEDGENNADSADQDEWFLDGCEEGYWEGYEDCLNGKEYDNPYDK